MLLIDQIPQIRQAIHIVGISQFQSIDEPFKPEFRLMRHRQRLQNLSPALLRDLPVALKQFRFSRQGSRALRRAIIKTHVSTFYANYSFREESLSFCTAASFFSRFLLMARCVHKAAIPTNPPMKKTTNIILIRSLMAVAGFVIELLSGSLARERGLAR